MFLNAKYIRQKVLIIKIDYCVVTEVETIKRDIIKNGPVIGIIPIYREFLNYKSGVY